MILYMLTIVITASSSQMIEKLICDLNRQFSLKDHGLLNSYKTTQIINEVRQFMHSPNQFH